MNSNTVIRQVLCFLLIIYSSYCSGQKKAIMETGDEVILYENGTWKFTNDSAQNNNDKIQLNPKEFFKSKNANFLLHSKNGNLGFWIDPKKWMFGKAQMNKDADFELQFSKNAIHGVIISEPTEVPIESYAEIALINGRNAAPDLAITRKEYRIVNGLKVLHLEMEGTQVGVKFAYSSYYYSNSISTVQFLVASYSSTMIKYTDEIDELLNGIVDISLDETKILKDSNSTTIRIDTTNTQGSLSFYNNCRPFFVGKWKYKVNNQSINVERTFDKTIEYTENRKYKFEYSNVWIDSCKYALVFVKTNKPDYSLAKAGEVITVEITEINSQEMKYSAIFRGIEIEGEMEKEQR